MSQYVYNDGGRKEFSLTEKLDCTVRALAIARNIPYKEAHETLAKLGRKPGKGFKFRIVAARSENFTDLKIKRCRVFTALRKLTKGRFVVRIRRHVFAVVDGVAHDTCGFDSLKNCLVTHVWQFSPTPKLLPSSVDTVIPCVTVANI